MIITKLTTYNYLQLLATTYDTYDYLLLTSIHGYLRLLQSQISSLKPKAHRYLTYRNLDYFYLISENIGPRVRVVLTSTC